MRARALETWLIMLFAIVLAAQSDRAQAALPTLKIYLWENYIDPTIVARFERDNDVLVNILTFDDDDQREETLLTTQGKGLDIICLNDGYMHAPSRLGWLVELDVQALPTLQHVNDPFGQTLPEARRYGVPYFWGTLGIAYRADLVETPPTSWGDLFSLAPRYSGRVLQTSTMRLLVGIALLATGADFNSEDAADFDNASRLLMGQTPHLHGYQTMDLSDQNPLVTGAAVMAPVFNGDLLSIQAFNPQIRYVYPKEGAHVWADYLAITRESPNRALAHKFLNYINEPEIALTNALHVNYATPNAAAKALAEEEYRNNPVIFASDETLRRAHLIRPLSAKALRKQTEMYVRTLSQFESLLERR